MSTTAVTEMSLNPAARELYTLQLDVTAIDGTTVDDAGPWEASFDQRVTWATGAQDTATGWWQWLVAGADADVGAAVAVIATAYVTPVVRLVDNPEIVARNAPPIVLEN